MSSCELSTHSISIVNFPSSGSGKFFLRSDARMSVQADLPIRTAAIRACRKKRASDKPVAYRKLLPIFFQTAALSAAPVRKITSY